MSSAKVFFIVLMALSLREMTTGSDDGGELPIKCINCPDCLYPCHTAPPSPPSIYLSPPPPPEQQPSMPPPPPPSSPGLINCPPPQPSMPAAQPPPPPPPSPSPRPVNCPPIPPFICVLNCTPIVTPLAPNVTPYPPNPEFMPPPYPSASPPLSAELCAIGFKGMLMKYFLIILCSLVVFHAC